MSIAFAAIGAVHGHVHGQIGALLEAGARLKWFFDDDPAVCAAMGARYDGVSVARSIQEILDDPDVKLVVSTVEHEQRAALAIAVMQHGKDYLCAKPGYTALDQLEAVRQVAQATGQKALVFFGERLASRATLRALELVQGGRIGSVIHMVGLGPHRLFGPNTRPDWWFDTARHGGILNDLASHQIDQFLIFTGSTNAVIDAAHVGGARFCQYPGFQDHGDLSLHSERAVGYVRVDWLTPEGLPTWGDVRLFLYGTEGTIEVRKNVDLDGRPGADHVLVVDGAGVERVPCADVPLPFAHQLIADIRDRTETAMAQHHCFTVCELALRAQAAALWVGQAP